MSIPDNAPVLVGIAAIQQKIQQPQEAKEPIALVCDAVDAALADCQAPAIANDIGLITIPKGMWGYSNPSALVAAHIGNDHCENQLADIGILQQTIIGKALQRIANGEFSAALVVGGEAKYRMLQSQIQGVEISETEQTDSTPDSFLQPDAELWSEIESGAGLGMPVGFYAILESAIANANGISMDEHRDRIANRYSRFSEIAAANPDAWADNAVSPEAIRDAGGKNRMLAFPYTKLHNSSWNVDQACALLFCSAGKAKALGIPEEKWVFPLASTESNQMLNISQRPALHRSAGARIAGQRALDIAGLSIDDMDYVELYSCFPAAVNLYARELGIEDDRDVTVTGSMAFAGGPMNNYFLQATVKLAELLRAKPGSNGLASCVSGMFTKQAYGLWSTAPYTTSFVYEDVTQQVAEAEKPVELVAPKAGDTHIVGYTVMYEGDKPTRIIAVCEYADGIRTVSYSQDSALLDNALQQNLVGQPIAIDDDGMLSAS